MPFRFVCLVPLLAWALCLAGCATSPTRRVAAGTATNRAEAVPNTSAPAAPQEPPEAPEVVQQRAEAHAHFMAALSAEMSGESDRGEEEFIKALELDPANDALALDLSRRLIARKQPERAIDILKQAAASPKASAIVVSRLGVLYMQTGKTNAAYEACQDAIKRQPKSIAGYQSLYTLYRQTGRTNEARRVLDQATKQDKVDAEFLVDLALLQFIDDPPRVKGTNSVVPTRAKDALKRAAAMNPTNVFVLQRLAQGLRLAGETKKASEIYSKLIADNPNLPGLREELTELLLRSNDTQGAAEQLEQLVRENPTNPQAYFFLGAIAYDQGKYAEAVEFYRKALLLNPENEQIYYDIAVAKIALNQAGEALDYLKQAEKRFKPSFTGEFYSALAWMRLKEYTNAVQHFTAAEVVASATETNRLNAIFYFQYGTACERVGRIGEAETLFGKTLQMSPDFAEALNYLGYMWAERGTNLVRAREMIEKAVKIAPTNAAYLDSLGWVLYKQGNAREALPQIQKAVELNKEPDATLYDHLGDIYTALNQPEKAREAWRKSLEIEPNKEVEKKLGEPVKPRTEWRRREWPRAHTALQPVRIG